MAVRFQLRRDTAANWTSTNPVLALGEPGVETDTLKVKVGDGVTAWNSLGYSITKDFTELTSKPTTIAGYGITDAVASSSVSVFGASLIDDADATTARTTLGLGTAATTAATAYATAAQGSTADTAVQPGDNIQTSIIDSADSSAITITPDVVMSAGLTVGNHIVPSSNENIDLGSATNRFKELFLSGNTIDLGGALIKRVAGNTVELPVGSNINGKNIAATDQELNTTDAVTFANITTSGYLRGPASFVIDPAAFSDDTGTVVIAGNLQVDGTTTTINSTTVAIDDLNFSIATDAADSAAANGAGISIGGAGATLNYTHATTSWDMNKPLNVIDQFTIQDTTGDFDADTADARIVLKAGNTTAAEFGFTNTTSGQFVVRNKLDGDMRFRLETTSKKFRFEDTTGNNTIATISNSGLKIGGGNTSASEALEVVGNIVATGLTVTDAYAWLNIDGSSTAQYSGGNLWLSNSATANNYGVALSSQVANADTTGSTFALNEVSSTGSYSKTIFSYDHSNSTFSHNQYNYFNSGLGVAGDISVTGTVDGRDVAADGTKLDGIEAGATADQTAADIRGLGFFDTTNDGGGSGLDADLLDGQHASEIIAAAVSQAGAQIGNGLVDINSGVGLTGSGSFNLNDFSNTSITISHADTSSVANTSNTNGNVVSGITFDTFGHTQAVTSTNLDNRYYTETELNAGQLNNLYYTETELNNGQLDTRYYTETEADNRFVNVTGDTMSGSLTVNADIIQSESKFVSITQTTASTSEVAILTFAHASFAAAEVLITATDATNRHMTKLLITHNGSTAIATEYGVVYTSTELATFDVLISASNLQLRATPASSSSTVFKIVATLIDA